MFSYLGAFLTIALAYAIIGWALVRGTGDWPTIAKHKPSRSVMLEFTLSAICVWPLWAFSLTPVADLTEIFIRVLLLHRKEAEQ